MYVKKYMPNCKLELNFTVGVELFINYRKKKLTSSMRYVLYVYNIMRTVCYAHYVHM